jgi:predicted CXXCH cytochrome family protein
MRCIVRWAARCASIAALAVTVLLVLALNGVQAAPAGQAVTLQTTPPASDEECLACHSQPDQIKTLPNGDQLYLTIDAAAYHGSLHGQEQVSCTDCHTNITGYPHPESTAQSQRQVAAAYSETCQTCHAEQYQKNMDSVHARARAEGDENAAVCSDCHNPHYTTQPDEPRAAIPATCAKCHSKIAEEYRDTVHGQALFNEDNPDVPTCIDCHGVHNIPDPTQAQFLIGSPQLCAKCHTDEAKMAKYGLNTNVLNSYISDFHGTTVELFQKRSPDQLPNKPLCIDCHGVHSILSTQDSHSSVFKANLLTTCQKCHPSATENFSDAWLSHYTPTREQYPLVYFVNLFYLLVIPFVIVGMVIFVGSDIVRRLVNRRKKGAVK